MPLKPSVGQVDGAELPTRQNDPLDCAPLRSSPLKSATIAAAAQLGRLHSSRAVLTHSRSSRTGAIASCF